MQHLLIEGLIPIAASMIGAAVTIAFYAGRKVGHDLEFKQFVKQQFAFVLGEVRRLAARMSDDAQRKGRYDAMVESHDRRIDLLERERQEAA